MYRRVLQGELQGDRHQEQVRSHCYNSGDGISTRDGGNLMNTPCCLFTDTASPCHVAHDVAISNVLQVQQPCVDRGTVQSLTAQRILHEGRHQIRVRLHKINQTNGLGERRTRKSTREHVI